MDIYIIFKLLRIWSFFAVITLAFSLLLCTSSSYIFKSSNKKVIHSYIPVYNLIELLSIVNLNGYCFILLLLPCTNILLILYMLYRLTVIHKLKFGFSLGVILLPIVFLPLLNHNLKTSNEEKIEYKDINLMSDEEINEINNSEEASVDNVYKETVEVKEKVPVFKANAIKYRQMMIDSESLEDIKSLKPTNINNEISSINKENNNDKESDTVEIVEL